MFDQSANYDVSRDALGWALEITLWECRTVMRRRHRSKDAALSIEALSVADQAATPDAATERRELEVALAATLSELPAADRQALAERLAGGHAGVPAATWRKRRERALARLKLLWRSQHDS